MAQRKNQSPHAEKSIVGRTAVGDVSLQLTCHIRKLCLDVAVLCHHPFQSSTLLQYHLLQLLHKVFQVGYFHFQIDNVGILIHVDSILRSC